MTTTRRFEYPDDKRIKILRTETASRFLWEAFNLNDDICIIQKVGGFEPKQIYYRLEREVLSIPAMKLDADNLYVAYEDESLIGEIISLTNPLTSTTEISIPSGIAESPVDVIVDDSDLYFLLPGNITGENAKIIKFNTSGVFQFIIDLSKTGEDITNAKSFTIDSNGDIQVVTYTDPTKVVRVFDTGGFVFDFESTEIV